MGPGYSSTARGRRRAAPGNAAVGDVVDYPNHTVLARRLPNYLRWRSAHARQPDVLAAQRRERPASAANASNAGAARNPEAA